MIQSADLIKTIEELSDLINQYGSRAGRVNESNTIRGIIQPTISALGWNLQDLDEVQSEYRHKPSDNPVDMALFSDGVPILFVEAKGLNENLDDRRWIIQTLNYANACNVAWAVLTNGEEWRVYNVHVQREAENKLFYSIKLTNPDIKSIIAGLGMIAKKNMTPKLALDSAWRESEIDVQMRKIIEMLPENKTVVRAMAKVSESLSEKDVRDALRRLKLRADWRDESNFSTEIYTNHIPEHIVTLKKSNDVEILPEKDKDLSKVTSHIKNFDDTDAWPADATHAFSSSGYFAYAFFDVASQQLCLLKGSSFSLLIEDHKYLSNFYKQYKRDLVDANILIKDGDRYILTENTKYLSPSAGVAIATTFSSNGWNYWKDRDGKSLQELRT